MKSLQANGCGDTQEERQTDDTNMLEKDKKCLAHGTNIARLDKQDYDI